MRETLYDFCIRTGQQTLLQEWEAERNAPLTPKDLSYGSKKKVWWICEQGHVWCASIASRTGGKRCGCPVCAGKVKAQKQAHYAEMIAEHKKTDR